MKASLRLSRILSVFSTLALVVTAYGITSLSLTTKNLEYLLISQRVKYWLVMRSSVTQGGNSYLSIPFTSLSGCDYAIKSIFSNPNLAPNSYRIIGYKCVPADVPSAVTSYDPN